MKKKLPVIFLSLLFVLQQLPALSQAPVFTSATPNSTSIARYDKFEVSLGLAAGFANHYDYNDITVKATFTSPTGVIKMVDGFFMINYTADASGNLTAADTGVFKVRFAPNEVGLWSYVISCTNRSGTATMAAKTFSCQSSTSAGYIRKTNTNYLAYDNGQQYIPIGEDMGWPATGGNAITDFTTWCTKLANNGGNFIRIWMVDFGFGIEWKNGNSGYEGLRIYKQSTAYYLDWLFEFCKQKNISIMLCLITHGTVSTQTNPQWQDSPYNTANGGPCRSTSEFFTNDSAKSLIKNRMRYIVARYGHSTSLQSWEIFNEVDWTDSFNVYKGNVTNYINEMSTYIRSIDVYKHLLTTSYALDNYDPPTWQLPIIDFTQTHFYIRSPYLERTLVSAAQTYTSSYNKPHLNGEFGLEFSAAQPQIAEDSSGLHVHNAIWASTFGGAMGSAMTWFWNDYVDPLNLYRHYKPLAALVNQINFVTENYKPVAANIIASGGTDVAIPAGFATFDKAPANDFVIDLAGNMTPGSTSLGQFLFGSSANLQYRNPPSFHVFYPAASQFSVTTGNTLSPSLPLPTITIYVDGVQVSSQTAVVASTYTANIPAGQHTITVDNLGNDWITVATFTFKGIGAPLTNYTLKSADTKKAVGYVLNNNYNWQYLLTNAGMLPPAISGSTIRVPAMTNGTYDIKYFNCTTGNMTAAITQTVSDNNLVFSLPSLSTDLAFTATLQNVILPVTLLDMKAAAVGDNNELQWVTASEMNNRQFDIETSTTGNYFAYLGTIASKGNAITNTPYSYVHVRPGAGITYYRLKQVDKDGKANYSKVVSVSRITGNTQPFVYPVPARQTITVNFGIITKHAVVEIFTTDMKLLKREPITQPMLSKEINIASLPAGNYLLMINSASDSKKTLHFLKQ